MHVFASMFVVETSFRSMRKLKVRICLLMFSYTILTRLSFCEFVFISKCSIVFVFDPLCRQIITRNLQHSPCQQVLFSRGAYIAKHILTEKVSKTY